MKTYGSILKRWLVVAAITFGVTIVFGVQTNTWQAVDDDWFNDANWSLGRMALT